MNLFLNLLIAQALMGAFDTIYHHELTVALPRSPGSQLELGIHAVRALFYGLLFAGLAWFEWHGLMAWLLIIMVLTEVILTLWDFTVEDQTRLLPKSERITHTLLAINGGAVFILLALHLPQWLQMPTAMFSVDYGWKSWFLSIGAIGVGLSGLRDGHAAWAISRLESHLKLDFGEHKKILLSGGTGFIGSALCRELLRTGHNLTLLTRHPIAASIQFGGRIRAIQESDILADTESFDLVINLAGAPVVSIPWSQKRKIKLLNSRLHTTESLMRYVRRAKKKPGLWIQASAIGIYGTDSKQTYNESDQAGNGFAAELCQRWEALTQELEPIDVRCITLRFGMVFGRTGGAMPMLMLPFRFGLGSIMGNGQQHLAWIHIEDLLRIFSLSILDQTLAGPVNAVAPECPQYQNFAKLAGTLLHRPVFLRIPANILTGLLGEMADMFIKGPIISPQVLNDKKFEYHFPDTHSALMDLL